MKRVLKYLYQQAEIFNDNNIIEAIKKVRLNRNILDVGCWDGGKTLSWAKAAKTKKIYGIEPVRSAAVLARKKGIKAYNIKADQRKWPIGDNTIDCIVSNQTIEHLTDVDFFFSECLRVLVKGGRLIISTNNLSSWHNVLAIIMGWAPFDLTNSSNRITGIGNPLAAHPGEKHPYGPTWTHKCVYTIRWLKDWGRLYGFKTVNCYGAGYYPLPAWFGRFDPNHSSLITLLMRPT